MLADIEEAIRRSCARARKRAKHLRSCTSKATSRRGTASTARCSRMELDRSIEPEAVRSFCEAYLSKTRIRPLDAASHGAADGAIQHLELRRDPDPRVPR